MSNEQKDPYEPDWSKSPQDWPECWHAVDSYGDGYFFSGYPMRGLSMWVSMSGTLSRHSESFDPTDWRKSLRKRPDNEHPIT